jgi:hypothetical protein
MTGDDVRAWETFLLGQDPQLGLVIDQTFDDYTREATIAFQLSAGLSGADADGVVGPLTFGKAMQRGFDPTLSTDLGSDGPNWPPRPVDLKLPDLAQRKAMFGSFAFEPAPTKANPEAIKIIDNWASINIKTFTIPQLIGVKGAPKSGNVQFHDKVGSQLKKAFQAIEDAGLKHLIKSWGGTWVPRYVRGSRRNLSNHAWGTALDMNMEWNALGARPALRGREGSVRELVEIFYRFGFAWGGWYSERQDGMHFEAVRVI